MATSGVLSSLNEIIASLSSGLLNQKKILVLGKETTISHPFSTKIGLMVIYGALLSTPVAHYYYGFSNKIFGGKQSPRTKILQLATALSTLSPFLSAVYVSWLAIINLTDTLRRCGAELCRLAAVVKTGLKKQFLACLQDLSYYTIGCFGSCTKLRASRTLGSVY